MENRASISIEKRQHDLQLIIPLCLGAIVAMLFSYTAFSHQETNFEDLALGRTTTSVFAQYDGQRIHCADLTNAQECLRGSKQRGATKVAVWLGNSQLHAVNQYQNGQETAALILFRQLQKEHIDLLTFSQPNANLQEHYVLFEYLRQQLPMQMLILPVVFDDLRETGLRSGIASAIATPDVVATLRQTDIGQQIIAQVGEQSQPEEEFRALRQTPQEVVEKTLNDLLEHKLPLWHLRPEIRGNLFNSLYLGRNWLFGIKPTSKRHLIQGPYKANLAALQAILTIARTENITVLLYIVPIRQDVELPYVAQEYAQFKLAVQRIAENTGSTFLNLEDIVPAALWGEKGSTTLQADTQEIDFMHFKAQGHALLADAIYQFVLTRQGR